MRPLFATTAIVLTLLPWLAGTDAFCIYNDFSEDITLSVIQYDNYGGNFWQKFQADIGPGGMSCCNYKNVHCNKGETPDTITTFVIFANPDERKNAGFQDLHVPSGGSARIGGNIHLPDVKVYDADDNPFFYDGPLVGSLNY
ncbi:hypothetical protein [Absidia glauca]|uniref:Uncharacterized protein n=1 Tax=Absidia glauca TaxID=4829 RepID=A0A168L534_ABSGL|nr:hypothetical protein [Absidia glauca]